MEGICPSLSVCTYEDTRELRPLMVGRFVDTVGQLYWSLAWNLSEPMNLQLLLVAVCLLHVQGGGSGVCHAKFRFRRRNGRTYCHLDHRLTISGPLKTPPDLDFTSSGQPTRMIT